MINSALNLVAGAVGQGRPQIIPAVVAPNTSQTPLPTDFTDSLFVVNPSDSTVFWEVTDWTVDHGGTLPQAGAAVALFYDSTGALRVVWWDGVYTPPAPPVVTGAAWIAPTLLNSWANLGSGFETAGYLKDPFGFVHLKGVIAGGATGTVAFTLPAGYRPGATTLHASGTATGITANVQVATSGTVSVAFSGSSNYGLSGITFLAEN